MGDIIPISYQDESASPPAAPYKVARTPIFPLARMREVEKLEGVARYRAGIEVLKAAGVCILPSLFENGGATKRPNFDITEKYGLPPTDGQDGPSRHEAIIGLFPPDDIDLIRDCISWQGLSGIDADIKALLASDPEITVKGATLKVFGQAGLLNEPMPPFWMSVSRSGG